MSNINKIRVNNVDYDIGNNIYSTEEQVIGTWVDGRPLYRKVVFYDGPINANETTNIGSVSPNIKDVLQINYTLTTSNKNDVYFNYVDGSSESLTIIIKKLTGAVMVTSIGENWASPDVFVTVVYTKTTDEGSVT